MTVNQLIERLMQLDGLAEVRIAYDNGGLKGVVSSVEPGTEPLWSDRQRHIPIVIIDWYCE